MKGYSYIFSDAQNSFFVMLPLQHLGPSGHVEFPENSSTSYSRFMGRVCGLQNEIAPEE